MATVTTKRIRRSPTELLQDLQAQRHALAEKRDARLMLLDGRIARVESRYEKSLKLAEFADVATDDLQAQLDDAKRNQSLLRQALKSKR